MTAAELKEQFDELVAQGRLEGGFLLLHDHLSKECKEKNTILSNQSQLSRLETQNNEGVLDGRDYRLDLNRITSRMIKIVSKLVDADIAKENGKKVPKEILIICRNEKDEFYMQTFCSRQRDLVCEVKQLKTYEAPTDYKFIIFDNHSIKDISNKHGLKDDAIAHLNLMKEYIEQYDDHQKYMIHFGENTDIVSQNRDIVHAANSKFTLYSRIDEMNKYIDHDCLYPAMPST